MEYFLFFLKGLIIGLVVGFPSGPVGFLYINRSTTNGFWAGFVSGLGSTLSHIFYAIIILSGFVKLIEVFNAYKDVLALICSTLLIILGVIIYKSKTKESPSVVTSKNPKSFIGYFFSALLVTFTNPIELIQFSFLMPLLGLFVITHTGLCVLIVGIVLGSLFWPVMISLYLGKLRKHLSVKRISYVQKFSALVLIFIGIVFIIKGLF